MDDRSKGLLLGSHIVFTAVALLEAGTWGVIIVGLVVAGWVIWYLLVDLNKPYE